MFTPDYIETERLILRRFKDEDIHDVFALMSDDYTCKMAGIPIFKSLERTETFMDNWAHEAYGITEKGCDKVIGIVQTPSFWWDNRAEIGYWLLKDFRGKGYMTEAIKAVSDALLERAWCDEIRIHVFVGNEASERVAIKCGFHLMFDSYKENVYSHYGTVESEECFFKTAGDLEWERRGMDFFSTSVTPLYSNVA